MYRNFFLFSVVFLFSFTFCKGQDGDCAEENFWKQEDYLSSIILPNISYNYTDITFDYDRTCALFEKSVAAFDYCKKNKMDTTFCLLMDLKIHSGKYRFFVWDLKNNKIVDSAMVSHGCGMNPWRKTYSKDCPEFSNDNNSHCSSLGKYKVGKKNYSQWGIHINYLLYGLDITNSNAILRDVVLHSWDEVPEQEVYPDGTPEGRGCPAVNNTFMKRLDAKLQITKKPVLLWLYYEE